MVEVKHLVKIYGDHKAVDDLSFSIDEGRVYGLLGPNGAGKSTTMNIMTGYLACTSGDVFIDGHDILQEPEKAKECIGYMPEIPPLYIDMTPIEYLNFVADLKKVPKEEHKAQVEKVIEIAGLQAMKNRLIKNLSKGYKQRVGLAQAILGDPKLIILDEPTVGLDPKQILEIREVIKALGKNRTVILSSHILSEVAAICDYIFIIADGKLVASDTPENLSKNLRKTATLKVTVKGKEETIRTAMESLHAVFTIEPGEEEGIYLLQIELEKDQDLREDVSFALGTARCAILGMNIESASLEDVFLTLTTKEDEEKEIHADILEEEEKESAAPMDRDEDDADDEEDDA